MDRPAYHLIVHAHERPTLTLALGMYRDDLARHEPRIAAVADEVTAQLEADAAATTIALDAAAMKVTWTALHTALDDSRRDQETDREHLHALLERLPGEHDMRAIDLETELDRR